MSPTRPRALQAVRNFVQLCLEGFYHDTIFHRIIQGFMMQGGDPTGTGNGQQLLPSLSSPLPCHCSLDCNIPPLIISLYYVLPIYSFRVGSYLLPCPLTPPPS